jgi:hypothetical protein
MRTPATAGTVLITSLTAPVASRTVTTTRVPSSQKELPSSLATG